MITKASHLRVLRVQILWMCVLTACTNTLPAEDRRITLATPVAKLSAADLWQDYLKDAAAANRRYFGDAVEVTGKVTAIEPSTGGASATPAFVMFGQTEAFGVRAVLLGDQAADILKIAKVGERLTLRCFVEGRILEGHVALRSCILGLISLSSDHPPHSRN